MNRESCIVKEAGYSLVELLIVVAIIGIMSAIAGLAYKSWTDKYNVERQTKEMYVDLMKARVDAMSRGRVFCVNLTPTSYTIMEDTLPVNTDGDGNCATAGDRTVMTKTLNYSIAWTNNAIKEFNTKGKANVKSSIYTTGSYGSSYDCNVIDIFRINMGKWDDKGTVSTADDECVAK